MKTDRRKHNRFPLIKDLAEPIDLFVQGEGKPRGIPAVITDLSAGGMSMVVFAHITGDTKLKLVINLPGVQGLEVEGHVAWTEAKGDTTAVGVQFTRISAEDSRHINHMAEDFQDCETKLSFGLKDVCFKQCAYWPLCHKPVKLKH